jgi:hypothetical protein
MAYVNQTRLHCANQIGKDPSKPLVARHGSMCELALRVLFEQLASEPHKQQQQQTTVPLRLVLFNVK